MRLGNCYLDSKGNECKDPYWTITDINDKSKNVSTRNDKVRIVKNGIHFWFNK